MTDQDLRDRLAITDVLTRYCVAVDSDDFASLRGCFTDDAVMEFHATRVEGGDTIVQHIVDATRWCTFQHHLIGNHLITVEGDTADAFCYLHSQQTGLTADGTKQVVSMRSTYTDVLVRTPEGWKLRERKLTVRWRQSETLGIAPLPGQKAQL
jgi:ketosteroid isomerase-like protein